MQGYFAALTIVLMLGMMLTRVLLLKRREIEVVKLDKSDFLIPPFALFYFYLVFANAFTLPTVSTQEFFHSERISWLGVLFCLAGLSLFLWSIVSFGKSFRIGIDTEHPDKLITSGVFAHSRNPIYIAFAFIFLGQFLIFSNWILLVYLGAAIWLIHRQVLREEDFLKDHYGKDYSDYCIRVQKVSLS